MLHRLTSRINHSCSPNATYVFRPGGRKVSVRSLVPIAAGAEVRSQPPLLPVNPKTLAAAAAHKRHGTQVTHAIRTSSRGAAFNTACLRSDQHLGSDSTVG